MNSRLFAFQYVFKNYYINAAESDHSPFARYVTLNLSMILALLSFATSYFTPSLYFYVLYATVVQIGENSDYPHLSQVFAMVVSLLYVIMFLVAVAGGLSGAVWTKHA